MSTVGTPRRIVIAGAGGRDFHDFMMLYRDDPEADVIAFTAAQIPGIAGRTFPTSLAGPRYPAGIPIIEEERLEQICRDRAIDEVVCAYSDLPHEVVLHQASRSIAAGARYVLPGARETMLDSRKPVIAVSAVRTGCGKSQTTRYLSRHLNRRQLTNVLVRHPMPYGDLSRQAAQRFQTIADLQYADCTIEEREEYEPHIDAGTIVYAGVDYREILKRAEMEADVILWDGGNNDFPFFCPDLHIVIVDALRPGQLTTHHPGEAVLRMADVVVINKADAVGDEVVISMIDEIGKLLPGVPVVQAASPARVEDPVRLHGQKVLIVEDGPTITHGGMGFGAGFAAVRDMPDVDIVDPRRSATAEIAAIYRKYPHIGAVLPAIGYGDDQRRALEQTINDSVADIVVSATPAELSRVLDLRKPVVRVTYDYEDSGTPLLGDIVDTFLDEIGL